MSLLVAVVKAAVAVKEIFDSSTGSKKPKSSGFPSLKGTVGYTLSFDTANIRIEKISHNRTSTGTMKVVLWAVPSYSGGTSWNGTRMAEFRLETCDEHEYYSDIKRTVKRKNPKPGKYTIILALESYNGEEYVMRDHRVFSSLAEITRDAKLIGHVGFTLRDDEVELRAEKIDHNFSGSTGTLKLVLWASAEGVEEDGSWTGHKLAKVKLGTLEHGYYYSDLERTVRRRDVPPGTYHIIMQLLSHTSNGWVSHDYREFKSMKDLE